MPDMEPHVIAIIVFEGVVLGATSEQLPDSPLLYAILTLASLGTLTVFAIGLVAALRRRTRPYIIIAAALGTMVLGTIVGFGTALGHVPMFVHHLVDHTLDLLIAVLILLAIYFSGT